MEMKASHGCCHKTAERSRQYLDTKTVALHQVAVTEQMATRAITRASCLIEDLYRFQGLRRHRRLFLDPEAALFLIRKRRMPDQEYASTNDHPE
jgi:hypothetical protein